jgi:drug/metabolite transporter (DMT)-like permease
MIGNFSVIGWMMLFGTIVTIPFLYASGWPDISPKNIAVLAFAGVGNVAGLLLSFRALQIGKVGLVAPIVSTEGALAAVMSTLSGESLKLSVIFALIVVVAGVVIAAIAPDPAPIAHENAPKAVLLSTCASLCYASTLFATGGLSGEIPTAWLSLPPRLAGVLFITLPLAFSKKLRISRSALPLVIGSGITEVTGFTCFAIGAGSSIAITSVIASQFAPIAALLAFILFKERLGRLQIGGIALIIVGVAALTVITS